MVVDFTVEHHDGAIMVTHWLSAGLQIQNGKASVCEPDGIVQPDIVFIRASVLLEAIHAVQDVGIGVAKNASDAAHASCRRGSLFKRCSKSSFNDYQRGYWTIVMPKRMMASAKPTW